MASRSRTSLRILRWLIAAGLAAVTAGLLFAGGLYLYLEPRLPAIDRLREVQLQEPLRVHAADGELLAVYGTKRRIPLEIEQIPRQVRNAFIAAEDDRFYEHPGVDWMGIARAAWNLVLTGEKGQGGSTITMQVARNFFLTREKTYLRKINEILLALKIEREIDKDEILELYLNKIYLGQRAYGVGAAAQIYYGKPVEALTLPETAMIAGLPAAPSRYNPAANPDRARERRNYVLRRMRANDMIEEETYRAALANPVRAATHASPVDVDAPYVGELARIEAVERFGEQIYTQGFHVYTTVDAEQQRAAIRALRTALIDYETRHGYAGPAARLDPGRIAALDVLERRVARESGGAVSGEAGDAAVAADGEVTARETLAAGVLGPDGLDTALEAHDAVGSLEPAVVVDVREDAATVYRSGGRLDPLPWEGMSWAAPKREGGGVGEAPEAPADVLAVGDIVYVEVGGSEAPRRLAQRPDVEGAFVALDPADGRIRALVGGFAFERSKFNRVTQARRQPGSNFKPFVYSAALDKGFTPATLVNDAPVVFEDPALEDTWRPENYSGRVFGPTRLREGLVYSRNLVSIRVLLSIGIPYAIDYVQRFGFPEEQLPHDLTLALGSASLTPLQVATGYSVFANMGFRVDPYLVSRIEDGTGDVVYRANPARVCPEPCEQRGDAASEGDSNGTGADAGEPEEAEDEVRGEPLVAGEGPDKLAELGVPDREREPEPRFAERVIEERNAYMVRSFLRDVARRGTGRGTRVLGRDDIAGKTGTTDDQLDAWFSGFNSSLVATAWVGYDQMKSLGARETGARAALPMWIDFMDTALAATPEEWPELPPGMVTVRIDPESGDYAGPNAEDAVFEVFRQDNAPEPPPEGSSAGNGTNGGDEGDGGDSEPLF
jgi:penicillin-binding protein 1A